MYYFKYLTFDTENLFIMYDRDLFQVRNEWMLHAYIVDMLLYIFKIFRRSISILDLKAKDRKTCL